MRKYRGQYPTRICSISNVAQGVALIETNEGGKYFLHARDSAGKLPKLGEDIYAHRFQRAQPVVFIQDAVRFHRVLDTKEAIPFVEYPPGEWASNIPDLDGLTRVIRRQFIHDMARQNILPRFQEDK